MSGLQARVNLQQHMAHNAARQKQQEEHAPRPARVRFFIPTVGIGFIHLSGAKAIKFGALMMEEPSFAYGLILQSSVKAEEFPLATATVTRWLKSDSGLYTGAEMGLRIDSANPAIKLKWSLTFEAPTLRSTVQDENNTNVVVASDGAQTTSFRR